MLTDQSEEFSEDLSSETSTEFTDENDSGYKTQLLIHWNKIHQCDTSVNDTAIHFHTYNENKTYNQPTTTTSGHEMCTPVTHFSCRRPSRLVPR